jgi:uncharacterized membrane protein
LRRRVNVSFLALGDGGVAILLTKSPNQAGSKSPSRPGRPARSAVACSRFGAASGGDHRIAAGRNRHRVERRQGHQPRRRPSLRYQQRRAGGGQSGFYAAEWTGGNVINPGGLPDSTRSVANGINGSGQAVGHSEFDSIGKPAVFHATEWSGSSIIDLGGLPGSTTSDAFSINDTGRAVGYSDVNGARATEWNDGSVIDLGGLLGSGFSFATSINDAGQVGDSAAFPQPSGAVATSSIWGPCHFS